MTYRSAWLPSDLGDGHEAEALPFQGGAKAPLLAGTGHLDRTEELQTMTDSGHTKLASDTRTPADTPVASSCTVVQVPFACGCLGDHLRSPLGTPYGSDYGRLPCPARAADHSAS